MKLISAVVFVCVCSGAPPPSMPDKVFALAGSCALLPCSSSPTLGLEVRLRVRSTLLMSTAFNSNPTEPVSRSQRELKTRVALAGDLSSGDCSLTIANISSADPTTYEIQLREKRGSWGSTRSTKLTITYFPERPVISAPAAVTVGQVAVVNCSVPISCPSQLPRLQWVWERGGKEGSSVYGVMDTVKIKGQMSLLVSSLSFTPSYLVKPRLRCEALYSGSRKTTATTELHVNYSPAILEHSSSCEWDGFLMVCRCTVDSNPRPAVTWSVNGSVPPQDYNTSSTHTAHTYSTHTLQETLQGPMLVPLTVICYAFNSIGNDSHTLLQAGEGSLWTLMSAVCVVFLFLLLLLLLVLLLCHCRRAGRRRRLMSCRPPVFEDSVYQDRLPLYINCAEVTNIYTNGSYQLIYQNCTPCFVRTKQTYKRQRRGARRLKAQRERGRDHAVDQRVRDIRTPEITDPDTAIYVEVI
uniref:Ig-like domain-containing protein n=1 Tax=Pygocentrus nattereri TaxID=42514 RepID=A0AAR2J936_PYGNA